MLVTYVTYVLSYIWHKLPFVVLKKSFKKNVFLHLDTMSQVKLIKSALFWCIMRRKN